MNADACVCRAVILDEADDDERHLLDELRVDPRVEVLDRREEQLAGLRSLIPRPGADLTAEPTRWAYYAWRRTVVGVLGPLGFRALRLDRNRNLITADEQRRLGRLRIGVAGLSVGHIIAHTLAAEGLCGEIRLADFDTLELSNLNRIPATVLDLGENKATLAARRIAELDPYLEVRVFTTGLTGDTVDEFLDGLDIVVEECDSLDMKAVVREHARARRLPVLMATSDRGLVDIERFDLEPTRPILHGLIGEVDSSSLAGMTARDKIPHMLGHLDVPRASAKAAASMVEVGVTLTTWPQLAGDVILGATAVAESVRRIGLGEDLPSGRVRIDVGGALDHLEDPSAAAGAAAEPPAHQPEPGLDTGLTDLIAAAAMRAPSGGNAQPWNIEAGPEAVTIRLASKYTSMMDVGSRGGAIAVGAALFNARVAAAAHGVLGGTEIRTGDGEWPLTAVLELSDGTAPGSTDPELAQWYSPMLQRETNRRTGEPAHLLDNDTVAMLTSAAASEGARLQLLTSPADIDTAADILGAADRIRYLSPRLHAEMIAELRFPFDPEQDTGIDVRTLELDFSDLAVLEILRRADVMEHLARWNAGATLGQHARDRIRASSALGAIIVAGQTLTDYARGGSATEAVWIAATACGLAVQPVSPLFVHARGDAEVAELSPEFAPALQDLQRRFENVLGVQPGESPVLMFRFAHSRPASVASRRSRERIRRR